MIIKVQPDKQKAISLKETTETTLKRLQETDKEKYPSNTLTDYYDIIRKLMEALNSLEGVKIKGEGAHKEIIDYVCDKHGFDFATKHFIQEMRKYRNKISYEGFSVKASYIKTNTQKIEKIINSMQKILQEKLKTTAGENTSPNSNKKETSTKEKAW